MFSKEEKIYLAEEIEKLILGLHHPEMPTSKPEFKLHVDGKEDWSWADIEPNHHYEKKAPGVNPWNERPRPAPQKCAHFNGKTGFNNLSYWKKEENAVEHECPFCAPKEEK